MKATRHAGHGQAQVASRRIVGACILCLGAWSCQPPSQGGGPNVAAVAAPSTRFDPVLGCCGDGPYRAAATQHEQADFEVARLDAQNVDWSVYAHHPNIYLRGLSLLRLRNRMPAASDAQLVRVVELLRDGTPIHTASCIELLTSCQQGQGLDMARGTCVRTAKTMSALADEVLQLAPPEQVVSAIVAYLAEPGLVELTAQVVVVDTDPLVNRLRDAAAKAPRALTEWTAKRLPGAAPAARNRLLSGLSAAPLGSADPQLVSAVTVSLQSKDLLERTLAAAAILRLTDQPGLVAVSTRDEPRKAAAKLLEAEVQAGRANAALTSIGPAASVLLDSVLFRLEPAKSNPLYMSAAVHDIEMVAAMGPRAAHASATLLALAAAIAATKDRSNDYELPAVIRALGDISAPAAEVTPFVLGHATTRELFAAAAGALVAIGAKLGPEELAALQASGAEHCSIPRHPRAFDGSWDVCFRANADLVRLERLARGEPIDGAPSDPPAH